MAVPFAQVPDCTRGFLEKPVNLAILPVPIRGERIATFHSVRAGSNDEGDVAPTLINEAHQKSPRFVGEGLIRRRPHLRGHMSMKEHQVLVAG
jgi:hypothetical protein